MYGVRHYGSSTHYMNAENNHHQEQIQTEAADWVARLNSGEVTDQQRQQFSHWVKQSPAHRQAFFAMREVLRNVNHAVENQPPQALQTKPYNHFPRLAIAACLLLAVSMGFIRYDWQNYWLADHLTSTGQQKTLTLVDGSRMYLNTDSAVAIDFNNQQRNIKLLHGEAEFVVAHDTSRPFVVATDNTTTTALGTDFSVLKNNDDVMVTVFENAVQVKRQETSVAVVHQGQQMRLQANNNTPEMIQTGIEEARSWRQGKLIFTAKPLQHVLSEINRYRQGEIILLADAVAYQPVSGIFEINQLDDSLSVIADTLALKTVQLDGLITVLY